MELILVKFNNYYFVRKMDLEDNRDRIQLLSISDKDNLAPCPKKSSITIVKGIELKKQLSAIEYFRNLGIIKNY